MFGCGLVCLLLVACCGHDCLVIPLIVLVRCFLVAVYVIVLDGWLLC